MRRWKDGFVAWDTETTGLGEAARIIEIASAAFSGGSLIGWASSLFDPGFDDEGWSAPDVQHALFVNGIPQSACLRSPRMATSFGVFERLFFYCNPLRIHHVLEVYVAHNARFDQRVLAGEAVRLQRNPGELAMHAQENLENILASVHLCTMGLDIALRPDALGHSLGATCARWGVEHGTLHRAHNDAQATGLLLLRMADELPDDLDEVLGMQDAALRIADEQHAERRRSQEHERAERERLEWMQREAKTKP